MTRPETIAEIKRIRDIGHSLQTIADRLNRRKVPTFSGNGLWRTGTIHEILRKGE